MSGCLEDLPGGWRRGGLHGIQPRPLLLDGLLPLLAVGVHLVGHGGVPDVVRGDGQLLLLHLGRLRGPGVGGGVEVGTEQDLDDSLRGEGGGQLAFVGLDVLVGPAEVRLSLGVLLVHVILPVVAEKVDNVEMVPLGCPVQSCPAVNIMLRVDVDSPAGI